MIPATFPLELYRGDSAHWQFTLYRQDQTPVDLTDVVAKSQIRDRPAGAIIVSMVCNVILPNIVDVVLQESESVKLPGTKGVWDLQLRFPSGEVATPIAGDVKVIPDVTDSTQPYVEPLKVVV